MVYGRYNELVNGGYKPTYHWGAPSCRSPVQVAAGAHGLSEGIHLDPFNLGSIGFNSLEPWSFWAQEF